MSSKGTLILLPMVTGVLHWSFCCDTSGKINIVGPQSGSLEPRFRIWRPHMTWSYTGNTNSLTAQMVSKRDCSHVAETGDLGKSVAGLVLLFAKQILINPEVKRDFSGATPWMTSAFAL